MYTYVMFGIAQDNKRTYESKWGTYSKKDGFNLSPTAKLKLEKEPNKFLSEFLDGDEWKIKKDVKKMTKEDIEKALGYKFELIGDEDKKVDAEEDFKFKSEDASDILKLFFG